MTNYVFVNSHLSVEFFRNRGSSFELNKNVVAFGFVVDRICILAGTPLINHTYRTAKTFDKVSILSDNCFFRFVFNTVFDDE